MLVVPAPGGCGHGELIPHGSVRLPQQFTEFQQSCGRGFDKAHAAHPALGCAHKEGSAGAAHEPGLASAMRLSHTVAAPTLQSGPGCPKLQQPAKGLQGGPRREDLQRFHCCVTMFV